MRLTSNVAFINVQIFHQLKVKKTQNEERKEEFGGNYEMEYNQIREEKEDIRYE